MPRLLLRPFDGLNIFSRSFKTALNDLAQRVQRLERERDARPDETGPVIFTIVIEGFGAFGENRWKYNWRAVRPQDTGGYATFGTHLDVAGDVGSENYALNRFEANNDGAGDEGTGFDIDGSGRCPTNPLGATILPIAIGTVIEARYEPEKQTDGTIKKRLYFQAPNPLCLDCGDTGAGGMGACCLADGSCLDDLTPGDCANQGGEYQGNNTACTQVTCLPRLGACCDPLTQICTETLQADCPHPVWIDGATCNPNPCPEPLGACCNQGTCSQTTQTACQGDWQGPGVPCVPNPCPQPPRGACCPTPLSPFDRCRFMLEAECERLNGNYLGDGSSCKSCPPLTGACCRGNNCFEATPTECDRVNGNFIGVGIICTDDLCVSQQCIGACCDPVTGDCTEVTQVACEGAGLVWTECNRSCFPSNPCPLPDP
jgi:hypothetical protein